MDHTLWNRNPRMYFLVTTLLLAYSVSISISVIKYEYDLSFGAYSLYISCCLCLVCISYKI